MIILQYVFFFVIMISNIKLEGAFLTTKESMKIKKLLIATLLSTSFALSSMANDIDGVPILPDEPTEVQMQLVRDGAKNECQQDDEDVRSQCTADYYAQHNLDEEPSCD